MSLFSKNDDKGDGGSKSLLYKERGSKLHKILSTWFVRTPKPSHMDPTENLY